MSDGRAIAAWGLVIVAGACADPAALDVVVNIEADPLSQLRLVLRDGDLGGAPFVDCRLSVGAPAEAACGLEGGTGRWDNADRFAFVLFGEPGDRVGLELEGLNGLQSVTATRVVVALPNGAGDRDRVDLTLAGRTEPGRRCAATVEVATGSVEPSSNPEDETAITVFDRPDTPGLELLLSVDGELVVATYGTRGDDCRLDYVPLRDPEGASQGPFGSDRWCRVHPGSLVVGRLADDLGFVAASLCARVGASGARLKVAVATMSSAEVDITTIDLDSPLAQVTMPRLADFDGNGSQEVVSLVQTTAPNPAAPVRVLRYEPRTARLGFRDVAGFGVLGRGQPGLPPLRFIEPDRGARLLIAGYQGPTGVFDGRVFDRVALPDGRSARAPVLVDQDGQPWLQEIRGNALVVSTRLAPTGPAGAWQAVTTATATLRRPVNNDELRRMSIGRAAAGTPLVALAVEDGVAGWQPGAVITPSSLSFEGVSSMHYLLQVNVDGEPGTEFIAFAPNANTLLAFDQGGRALAGWPVTLTGEGGARRVLVTDLEPAANDRVLRSAEIVALTYRRLEAISLGASSYDAAEWPWPSIDGGARGAWTGPEDPFQR